MNNPKRVPVSEEKQESDVKTGLGDYWQALNTDVSAGMSVFLDHLDRYQGIDMTGHAPKTLAPVEQIVQPMVYQTELVAAIMWLAQNANGSLDLVSHYPMVLDGARVDAKVVGHTPWDGQIEGYVQLQVAGRSLTCMDPLFPLTEHIDGVDELASFSLAGFGVSIHPLWTIAEHANSRPQLAASLSSHYETGHSILLDLSGSSDAPELHLAIGIVNDVREDKVSRLNVLRVTMEALAGLELPLIFGATSIGTPGWTPSAGERVAITFLLQGCMSSAVQDLQARLAAFARSSTRR